MLWRRRWVIGGTVLLVTSIAVLVSFQLTPRYTATAEVLVDPRESKVADVEAVLAGLSSDASTIDSQIQVIRSRSLAARVIQQLALEDDPEFNASVKATGVISETLHWIQSLAFANRSDESAQQRLERDRSEVINRYLENLSVFQVGRRSFVIAISFTSDDPRRASEVANTVAELYLVEQLEAKFEATQRATEWLDERLGALRETLRTSEEQVEAYRTERGLVDSAGLSIDEQQLSEINAQLILSRAHLAEKRARFRQLNELVKKGAEVESLAEVLASDEIANLRGGQAELAREQADLMSRYGDRHPMMIKIRAQLKDLNLQVGSEVKRIVANFENEVAVARSRTLSLQNSLDTLQGRRSSEQIARIRLRALQRESQANRALYESFLGRFKETSEQVGTGEADGHIISAATAPLRPSYPRKGLFAIVGLFLSLGAGFGAAFLLERLDNGFRTAAQLEETLRLPYLGSIPELSNRERTVEGQVLRPEAFVLAKPLSAYSEALRSLRSALLLSNVDTPPRVIGVTSSMPSEGKTTLALSLGRASAQSGIPTLVIDADLRRSSVAAALGHEPEIGLVECLTGQAKLDEAILHDEASALSILPVSVDSVAANPPDLLGSESMRALLDEARNKYGLVLVDSAPVLAVSDMRVLGQACDTLLFVAQWERTPRGAALEAVGILRQFGIPIAGVSFTRIDLKRHAKYGYGDADSYYEEYARYYSD